MAERRMFAKSILESDPFMDMPAEAQMLYVRLCMAADDDGFCDNPRSIMRACGASNDTMKILISKKFVLTFDRSDCFVVVIKHWRMNNYIRKDTYRETKYKEFMKDLYYDENQSYSLNPGDGHVPCIPASSSRTRNALVTGSSRERDESLTQDRIGKDRKDKDSLEIGKDRKEESEGKGEIDTDGLTDGCIQVIEQAKKSIARQDIESLNRLQNILVKLHHVRLIVNDQWELVRLDRL